MGNCGHQMENDNLELDEIFEDEHPLCDFYNHCYECRKYWNRMVYEGMWVPYEGWTDKAIKEFLK